jgi:hypothetical protein
MPAETATGQALSIRAPAALRAALEAVADDWHHATNVAKIAALLTAVTADIDRHIDRRAHEVAVPLVAEAERAALERVAEVADRLGEAQFDAQRWKDCSDELRRHVAARDRQNARLNARIAELEAKADA